MVAQLAANALALLLLAAPPVTEAQAKVGRVRYA